MLAASLPRRFRRLCGLAGCGCSGPAALPGALAPVAIALAWLSFGPLVALVRAGAALAVALAPAAFGRRRTHEPPLRVATRFAVDAGGEPFGDLGMLAASSAAAALLAGSLLRNVAGGPGAVALGLLLGAIAPCATAGVALAAGFLTRAPLVAFAILATTGIVSPYGIGARFGWRRRSAPGSPADDRFACVALGVALGLLAFRGPSGLVHPRLIPLVAIGGLAAFVRAARSERSAGAPAPRRARGAFVPAIMLVALVLGSPPPAYSVTGASVAGAFPGEPFRFTGIVHGGRVTRFAIACCRIDATEVGLDLARSIPERNGSWVALDGRFEERRNRLVAVPEHVRGVPAPDDPYLYL